MSTAPIVIQSRSTPFLSVSCAILLAYFVVKATVLEGGPAIFSLVLGATVAVVGLWWLWRSQRRSVLIDGDRVVITNGRRSSSHSRAEIVSVNLASLEDQIVFANGSGVRLPLEGNDLVRAGVLLTPPRRYRAV